MSDLQDAYDRALKKLAAEGLDMQAAMTPQISYMAELCLLHRFLAEIPGFDIKKELEMFDGFLAYDIGKMSDILGKNDVKRIFNEAVGETMQAVRARGQGGFQPAPSAPHPPLVVDDYKTQSDFEAAKIGANNLMFAEKFMWEGCLGFGDVSPGFDGHFDRALIHRIVARIPGIDLKEDIEANDKGLMKAFRVFSKSVGLSDVKRILEANAADLMEKISAKPAPEGKIQVSKPLQFKPKAD